MSNSDSNFTHFLCFFVGYKCAKVKKIQKNTAFTVKDGVQITNGCSIY